MPAELSTLDRRSSLGPRVVAIAETDAYLKWVANLLEQAPSSWRSSIELVSYTTTPSRRQREAAVVGTRWASSLPGVTGLAGLRRRLEVEQADVVVLACTGPLVEAICTLVLDRLPRRPIVVAGLPGVGVPVERRAIEMRRGVDVFIAHGCAERAEYRAAFDAIVPGVRVALARLPFLSTMPVPDAGEMRTVFAPQSLVPVQAQQRSVLVQRLVSRSPDVPLVKTRTHGRETTTHHERFPYELIVSELVAHGVMDPSAVEFVGGPMSDAIERARCVVTVSSTAALEAIARGVPVAFVADFGIGRPLLNQIFVDSGCMVRLDEVDRIDGRHPSTEWAEAHYFHDSDLDDWVDVIEVSAGIGGSPGRSSARPRPVSTNGGVRVGAALARSLLASGRELLLRNAA